VLGVLFGMMLFGMLFTGPLLVLYFVPTIIALARKQRNTVAIAVLNFFLGWTFVGWVVALVWALTETHAAPARDQTPR
jgi:hypothetical protein